MATVAAAPARIASIILRLISSVAGRAACVGEGPQPRNLRHISVNLASLTGSPHLRTFGRPSECAAGGGFPWRLILSRASVIFRFAGIRGRRNWRRSSSGIRMSGPWAVAILARLVSDGLATDLPPKGVST